MINHKSILQKTYVLYAFILLFSIGILIRILYIQQAEGKIWDKKLNDRTVKYRIINAVRGNIYDSEGSLLATSVPIYDIAWDPNPSYGKTQYITDECFEENIGTLSEKLSDIFPNRSKNSWKQKLVKARNRGSRYMQIGKNFSYEVVKKIKEFPIFNLGKNTGGLIIIQKNKRKHPFQMLASRTIGYKNDRGIAVGLEGAYDKQLSGVSGKQLMRKIMKDVEIPISSESKIDTQDGYDIYSTIDINIQDVAETALYEQLVKHNAAHGCVVLMEVKTGEIRAIANLTKVGEHRYNETYNYAVGRSTEPGSTFKLASYMVALEDGYIDLNDLIETGDGKYYFYNSRMEDSKKGGYGTITVKDAFAYSSNIAIAKIIEENYKHKPQTFIDNLYKLGLNEKLNLEIEGEGNPKIKSTNQKSWSGISLPWISHGYEVEMTPLQILAFYNGVANNGKVVKPMFVRKIQKDNTVIKEFKSIVLKKKIASQETIDKIKEMLEAVVEYGTATNLKDSYIKIAGKTGTVQIANEKYGYKSKKTSYEASFCGYFPADEPKYSCIVVVSAPSKNVYYGNVVAGPIFKEIAKKVYSTRLEMHKKLDETIDQSKNIEFPLVSISKASDLENVLTELKLNEIKMEINSFDWIKITNIDSNMIVTKKEFKSNLIPKVVGMNAKDAIYLLENFGLKVEVEGCGLVKRQSLRAGQMIRNGAKIKLKLG